MLRENIPSGICTSKNTGTWFVVRNEGASCCVSNLSVVDMQYYDSLCHNRSHPSSMPVKPPTPARGYQKSICRQLCDHGGGVVNLPTGAGKTFIAAECIIHKVSHLFPSTTLRIQSILFAVPTLNLVTQQLAYLQDHYKSRCTDPTSCACCGVVHKPTEFGANVQFYTFQGGRSTELHATDRVRVIVGTAESLAQNIKSITAESAVCMLILDEVHHCAQNHPYSKLSRAVLGDPTNPVLRSGDSNCMVVGLSASLSYARQQADIESDIFQLCKLLRVLPNQVFKVSTEELKKDGFAKKLDVQMQEESLSQENRFMLKLPPNCSHNLPSVVLSMVSAAKNARDALVGEVHPVFAVAFSTLCHLEKALITMKSKGAAPDFTDYHVTLKNKKFEAFGSFPTDPNNSSLKAYHHLADVVHLLVVTKQTALEIVWRYMKLVALDDLRKCGLCEDLVAMLSCNEDIGDVIPELLRIVREWFSEREQHKAVIFVTHRLTAEVLKRVIDAEFCAPSRVGEANTGEESECNQVAVALYSQGVRCSHSIGKLSPTQFAERMKRFRDPNDPVCVAVATTVAEEGVDLPSLNLVVHFDAPQNPVSFVQRTGRARHLESKIVALDGPTHHLQYASQLQDEAIESVAYGGGADSGSANTQGMQQQSLAAKWPSQLRKIKAIIDTDKNARQKVAEILQLVGQSRPRFKTTQQKSLLWTCTDVSVEVSNPPNDSVASKLIEVGTGVNFTASTKKEAEEAAHMEVLKLLTQHFK